MGGSPVVPGLVYEAGLVIEMTGPRLREGTRFTTVRKDRAKEARADE
jgi:hypothetical protein